MIEIYSYLDVQCKYYVYAWFFVHYLECFPEQNILDKYHNTKLFHYCIVNDFYERNASELNDLTHYNNRLTISNHEVKITARFLLQGEFVKRVASQGTSDYHWILQHEIKQLKSIKCFFFLNG